MGSVRDVYVNMFDREWKCLRKHVCRIVTRVTGSVKE